MFTVLKYLYPQFKISLISYSLIHKITFSHITTLMEVFTREFLPVPSYFEHFLILADTKGS